MQKLILYVLSAICILNAQEAPTGSSVQPDSKGQKALESLKGKVDGKIVWSSSRSNSKHDIWIMNADGTEKRQLTKGNHVDWFSRFSPDGKTVLFTRSKSGWERESEADVYDRWDLFTISVDGTNEQKVADNGCWGTWRPGGDSIVFARGPKVILKDLKTSSEVEIFDAVQSIKKGTYSQEPQLSPDGKKIAITLRGSSRETGVWNVEKKQWYKTGAGCQSDWFPDGKKILRMNEGQGNGGTEVLAFEVDDDGKPLDKFKGLSIPKHMRFMDLPGRRSHEYFPKLDQTGNWLVWCATRSGHEHDMVDYEVYIWNINSDKKSGPVRLTFHSGNDRWPDLYTISH